MNEKDLNEAMHDVLVRSSPPPSMDPASALDRARRVRKRRRATWAGLAAVPLVAGVVAGPTLIANLPGGGSTEPMVAGGGTTTAVPTTRKSGDPWPEGQADRTATAGPRAERAVTLMDDLSSSVPAGFSTPDLKYPDGRAMRSPQSQYASNDGEQDYWQYRVNIPVQKGDRVGQLLVESFTPDGKPATTPCKLAQSFWGGRGTCAVVDVAGKKVGVVTTKGDASYDQWAAYRHANGSIVYLAQVKKSDHSEHAALTQPIFSTRQLAELVTSTKFQINS
ncbi:hypothetical protein GCM10029976_008640 [Kribbella albertanoniae]|uniref:Uncharacterized protein n=1 Tax=Kribbella albertanoniae TaxID=1266829 RepID=A0A4R4PIA3_9ACTN|nr:hypothetical protein [Kribbella albertanoniae]TDC21594.1 hypothetical protein E1261_33005 [Kribbella albertanoniae]